MALLAGVVATVVMTVVMALVGSGGMPRMMGSALLGSSSSATAQWAAGLVLHLGIGVSYALVFAVIIAFLPAAKVKVWLAGGIFGLALTLPAILAMGPFMDTPAAVGGNSTEMAGNPCGPSEAKQSGGNPCNPCGEKGAPANPCNPCNPCGGESGGGFPWQSILVHLGYGLGLGATYRTKQIFAS